MATSSRFIRVHADALIEYIWDDEFFYDDNYSIINDVKNTEYSFAFSKNAVDPVNYNKIPYQLYLIDNVINKFGIADPDNKSFLQESKYVNNQPSNFDQIKIWFPIYFTFPNTVGFYLNVSVLNYDNVIPYNFANYFLDITIPGELAKLTTESQPLRLNENLWGKSITIYVPSVYNESRNRVNNAPQINSINYNLTNGVLGLSTTTSITLDFRFLVNKTIILNDTTFITTPPILASLPQAPEFNNLAVQIIEATDGDYFVINGIYNSSISDFDIFVNNLAASGNSSYILYSITVFEENLPQETRDIYVYQDFYKGIDDYRPVLKFSNTTASIQVEMKLINAVDSSVISRIADYTLIGNSVTKYGKFVTPINISNAFVPNIYNSKSTQNILPAQDVLQSYIKRKITNIPQNIVYIPYPVLTSVYNVVASDVTQSNNQTIFLSFGELELVLSPFDNIIKIKIATKADDTQIVPFNLSLTGAILQLVFKSATSEVRVPLYLDSNEVDLINAVLVFKILASQQPTLKKIFETNQNFYITLTTNDIETVIYDGTFTLLEETARVVNTATTVTNNTITPAVNTNTAKTISPLTNKVLASAIAVDITDHSTQSQKVIQQGLNSEQIKKLK